jgi:hypothetical protein
MNEIPNITGGAVGNVNGSVIPNGVVNNANPIPNAQVGNAAIPTLNINEGPRVISAIDPPVIRDAQQSLIRSLAPPVFTNPDGSLKYPTLRVPTQAEFDEAVRAEKQAQEDEKAEKSRGLPDAPTPFIPPAVVTPPVEEVRQDETPPVELPKSNLGVPVIEVPIIGEVPIPPKDQVLLAGTTATASVAAALIGKSLVEWMVKKLKPIVQQILIRGKKLLNRDLTPYELQYTLLLKRDKLKNLLNYLAKEKKEEKKLSQYKKHTISNYFFLLDKSNSKSISFLPPSYARAYPSSIIWLFNEVS